ncbi:MAG: DUF4469 domain-containing protein [Treponema sp.]|nr:DUF4469 domain-containing protein [Treponema sp.]
MIDSINQFNKQGSLVSLNLSINQFDKDGSFIGKITRRTVGLNDLIGGIIKKNTGVNENIINNAAALLQLEILENLATGNAVNILNLGVLYAAPENVIKKTSAFPKLCAKFTTSKLANSTAAKLSVQKMFMSNTSPTVMSVTDFYDEVPQKGILTKLMMAEITGERLKLGGTDSGIFFAPLEPGGNPVSDEAQWTKVDDARIKRNTPKSLLFYVPDSLAVGTKYRVIVRTAFTGGGTLRKTPLSGSSEVVTVKNAA